jgi:hypothetical protein
LASGCAAKVTGQQNRADDATSAVGGGGASLNFQLQHNRALIASPDSVGSIHSIGAQPRFVLSRSCLGVFLQDELAKEFFKI